MITIPVFKMPRRTCKARGRREAVHVGNAIVDDDMARLADFFWIKFDGYAVRYHRSRRIFMQHDVIGRRPSLDVSHENANKLDKRASGSPRSQRSCPPSGWRG